MKKIICSVILSIFAFNTFALSKINSAVEESESQEKVEKPKDDDDDRHHSRRRHDDDYNHHSSYSEDESESLGVLLFKLICLGWAMNQLDTAYNQYPYSDGKNYIVNSFTGKNSSAKLFAANVDTQALAFNSLGVGNETRFECMLSPFVRFYAGNTLLYDEDERSGFFRVGGSIPIIQFNTFSAFFDMGYMQWYGPSDADVLTDGDFMFGFVLKSSPIKPLILEARFLFQNVTNETQFCETTLHVGFMLYRNVELFGEFKRYSVDHDNGDKMEEIDGWTGGGLGVRAYF